MHVCHICGGRRRNLRRFPMLAHSELAQTRQTAFVISLTFRTASELFWRKDMSRIGLFFMPAILLAMATAVHAQTPPATQSESGCPAATWYFQAYQDSAAALQK